MNSYGDPVSTMAIVSKNRASFMLGAPSSEVPGGRYKPMKSREFTTGKCATAIEQFCVDNSNMGRYYTYWVRLEKTNNFHVWTNPIGGLYEKFWTFEEAEKK